MTLVDSIPQTSVGYVSAEGLLLSCLLLLLDLT